MERYPPGTKVRIVDNVTAHDYPIGSIVEIIWFSHKDTAYRTTDQAGTERWCYAVDIEELCDSDNDLHIT